MTALLFSKLRWEESIETSNNVCTLPTKVKLFDLVGCQTGSRFC